MKTILITGCSSGFGLATASLFHARGWNVVATTRTPRDGMLPQSEQMRVLPLDVTDPASIAALVEAAGPIDALVNNAGIGLLSAVEGTPIETVRALFETNTLGPIALAQAVLPQMRERGDGVIVNVTSTVTFAPLPLLSIYTATKAAVNAWSDGMTIELEPFGIRVRVVLPGRAPATSFYDNAKDRMAGTLPAPYAPLAQSIIAGWQDYAGPVTAADEVAEGIWCAVTDVAAPAHISAGADAIAWAATR